MTGDPLKADPGCWRTSKEHQAEGLEVVSAQNSCIGNESKSDILI